MADDGVTPEICERILRMCREFVGGSWAQADSTDVTISRIRGGLSNMLYLAELADRVEREDTEPKKVLIRLYGQIIQENPETVVTDSVIYALLAEKQLGPKLYGVFTGGRVEEYVKNRKLRAVDLRKPAISVACAKVMVRFHQLRMPLIKEPRWLFDIMTRYLDEALNNMSFDVIGLQRKDMLQRVLSYGLSSELLCLKHLLAQVSSPVVFCHNDLQEGNILFSNNGGKHHEHGKEQDWQLIPIDFEYASYNYRGFDIANHFCEWCYDYSNEQPPYYTANLENFPSREQQMLFLREYVKGLKGANEDVEGTAESILCEVAAYTLASDFMWGVWSLVQAQISSISFGYLEYAVVRLDAYFHHKKQLLEQYELTEL